MNPVLNDDFFEMMRNEYWEGRLEKLAKSAGKSTLDETPKERRNRWTIKDGRYPIFLFFPTLQFHLV